MRPPPRYKFPPSRNTTPIAPHPTQPNPNLNPTPPPPPQALRTMGMSDTAYWSSWGLWEVTLAFVVANSICIYGLILQFDLFLHNNYG